MKKILKATVVLLLLWGLGGILPPSSAHHGVDGCDHACVERVKAEKRAELERRHRRALVREMRRYKANPMPACTWEPESSWDPATGQSFAGRPFAPGRYRVKNPSSTASGKFQFLTSTWLNIGGGAYASEARYALPVYQERMARRLAADSLDHWVNC